MEKKIFRLVSKKLFICRLLILLLAFKTQQLAGQNKEEQSILLQNWEELKKRSLRLTPVPKRIKFEEPVTLSGSGAKQFVIVLDKESERGNIASAEITSRILELGITQNIPVVNSVQNGVYNIIIENNFPNSFDQQLMLPEMKVSDQCYRLTPRSDGIVLSGKGEMGMLYAAVTLRWLIERSGDKILLHSAKALDWPDFSRRSVSELGPYNFPQYYSGYPRDPQKGLEYIKPVLDYIFRLKATDVFRLTISSYRKFSPFTDQARVEANDLLLAKAVSDYASKRGVGNFETTAVSLGEEWSDKDNPEVQNMLHYKTHKQYFSWARHDLHQKKSDQIANFCEKSGTSAMFMHALDGGGLANPELWSDRDELTKQKYGNDRADADMFNIYYQAFLKKNVQTWLVCYPYNGAYLDVDFGLKSLGMSDTPEQRKIVQKYIDDMKNWSAGVNKKVPLDLAMCVRESDRATLFNLYNLYPGRPMFIYYEVYHPNRNIGELLPNEIAAFWSSYDSGRAQKDILWCNYGAHGNNPLTLATFGAQMEYAWNTSFPGAADLKRQDDPLNFNMSAQQIMAERTAVALWGHDAGQLMKEVYAWGLSYAAACAPRATMAGMKNNFKRYKELGEMMSIAANKACAALDQLWSRHNLEKTAGRQIIDKFSYPYFIETRRMVKAARVYAAVHFRLESANEFIINGDIDRAGSEIAGARNDLKRYAQEYAASIAEMKNEGGVFDHSLFVAYIKRFPGAKVMDPNFSELEKKIADLDAGKLALFQEYNVPQWFKDEMSNITLTAVKTSSIILDGFLSESAWAQAQPVERFVAWKVLKHIDTPAAAYFTYDENNLYLGFRAEQKYIASIAEPKRSLKEYPSTESIEVFIVPDADKPAIFYQIVVDTAANIFTIKNGEKAEIGWDGKMRAAVKKDKSGWSLELAMPFASFGKKPDANWKAIVAYNHISDPAKKQMDNYSCVFFDGKLYKTVELYSSLSFSASTGTFKAAAPELFVSKTGMVEKTHERGAGSLVSYLPRLETSRPLYDVVINARFLDSSKKQVFMEKIYSASYLPLLWTLSAPVQTQLETAHDALILELDAQYKTIDGKANRVTIGAMLGDTGKFLKEEDIYAPGDKAGFFGIANPFWFESLAGGEPLISFEKGTIEFWLKVDGDITPPAEQYGSNKYRSFLYWGKFQAKYPAGNNVHCMTIYQDKKYANIYFAICNENYDKRITYIQGVEGWKKNTWLHLAFVWNLNQDGKAIMEIYVNGKLSSVPVKDKKGENDSAFLIKPATYGVQAGSFPSGEMPASAVIQNLCISREMTYRKDFTPQISVSEPENGVWFSGNKTLEGKFKINGKKGTILAKAGSLIKK